MRRVALAAALLAVLIVGSEVLAGGHWGCWTQMNPSDSPTGRGGHEMAYDVESDRVIIFGGWDHVQPPNDAWFDDTWAYDFDTDTWEQMNPASHPSTRSFTAMAYDTESDRIILFGGYQAYMIYFDDTWAYDHNTDTWIEMHPTDCPRARQGAGVAYDVESDRVVIFGGNSEVGWLDDTWAYDFKTNTWTQMNPTSHPSARGFTAMAYDLGSDRAILFGGWSGYGNYYDDTWAYDFDTDTWEQMNPTSHPSARAYTALAHDTERDRTVLFSGKSTAPLADTWAYDFDTDTWTEMMAASRPAARHEPAMAYDAGSGRVVLFGGWRSGCYDDTWAFETGVSYPPDEWLWPFWNWISIPAIPDDPDPNAVLGFDCGGRLWYWDKYGKTAQVYQPPFVTFDLMVADSYLLWLDDVPDPVWYEGGFVRYPFDFKLGRMGWTWLGMPRLTELGTTDFMDNVCVQYPVDGPVRTAAEDYASTPDNWIQWGWSFWDGQAQSAKTFTPYAPFGDNICCPWVGYRCWTNVGSATDEEDPDQVTIIWPSA